MVIGEVSHQLVCLYKRHKQGNGSKLRAVVLKNYGPGTSRIKSAESELEGGALKIFNKPSK